MNIIKNFLYNLSYQILVIILPIITVPYVSNVLGAKGIGDYAFTFANTQYFILFGMIGITLYGNRQIAYVRDDKEKLNNNFYSIYFLQFICMSISSILFLIYISILDDKSYKSLYIIQGINILASLIDISWLFIGLEQFKKTVLRNILVRSISFFAIFIFVKDKSDIISYTLILALSNFLGNLSLWLYIPKIINFKKVKIQNLRIHLKSSIGLFIPQIAIQVYALLSKTILGVFTDTVQVGYYENSQKIIKITLTIATAVGTVMMPKISNTVATGDMDKVKYYIKNSFFFISAISVPLAFGLIGISKELCPWFFGEDFLGIENLISISSITIILIGWTNVLGTQLLVPLNRTKDFTISVVIGAIINFVLNIIFLKYTGAIGASVILVITEIFVTITQMYLLKDFLNIFNLIKSSLVFFPGAVIMLILVKAIGSLMGSNIIVNIIQVLLGSIIYFIVVLICYKVFYNKNLIEYIKSILNK